MRFVTYHQMLADLHLAAQRLPPVAGIIGIPRSGAMVGSILALHLHVPFATVDEAVQPTPFPFVSKRLEGVTKNGVILLVDDSCYMRRAMDDAESKLDDRGFESGEYQTFVLYATSETAERLDHYHAIIDGPRLFEWNLFNSHKFANGMTDLDGVLCPDPPSEDDTAAYESFIVSAPMLNRPRRSKQIVTCRLEKYRPQTEDWLRRHGVDYDRLVMADYPTPQERRRGPNYGLWKGELYRDSDCILMVESSASQAKVIAHVAQKPVISVEGWGVF